jgi:DNA excision repair protein ERCC-3
MRPEGRSLVYVLATRGSREEDFAQRRMRHLSSKGVRVSEAEAEAVTDDESTAGEGEDSSR